MRVLHLSFSNSKKTGGGWIDDILLEKGYVFDHCHIPESSLIHRFLHTFFLLFRLGKYDAVVTTEYYMSFFVNIRLLLTCCRVKHIIWGLNQSRRLLVFKYSLLNRTVTYVFNRSDLIITHSNREIELFVEVHGIKRDKFNFTHWGFDLPDFNKTQYVDVEGDYICMIGRNNRDWQMFADSVKLASIKGVAVCSSTIDECDYLALIDAGIHVYKDLDMETCLNIINYSLLNVVFVKDDKRGAGHITVVASMLMSKPQLISDVQVLSDYFKSRLHGFNVPISDPVSASRAILEIKDSTMLADFFGENALKYAEQNFTRICVANKFDFHVRNLYVTN